MPRKTTTSKRTKTIKSGNITLRKTVTLTKTVRTKRKTKKS
jgi:hypothetical protein